MCVDDKTEGHLTMYERIVVGTDGSEQAHENAQRGEEDQAASVEVGELAPEWRADCCGHDVRGADPGEGLEGLELSNNGRERRRDDRHLHRCEHHRQH